MTQSKPAKDVQRDKSKELRELLNRQHQHLKPVRQQPKSSDCRTEQIEAAETSETTLSRR
jgi:hypothetical protein